MSNTDETTERPPLLDLIDPEIAAALTEDLVEPEPADDEAIARWMRRYRHTHRELAVVSERFDRELHRVADAKAEATKPLQTAIDDMATMFEGWMRMRLDNGLKAKTVKFPDGEIRARKSTRLQTSDKFKPETLPEQYQRVKIEVDANAVKAAIKFGVLIANHGDMIDPESGELITGLELVEITNITAAPAKDTADD